MSTVLAVLLMIGSFTSPAGAQAGSQPVLAPGDSLLIAIVTLEERPDLSGMFGVRQDGTIGSPVYSGIRAAGRTVTEIEQDVRAYVHQNEVQNPRMIVDAFFQVTVAGEVRQPGVYPLPVGSTVMHALLRAGGVNERGANDRVVLYRNGRTIGLDLSRPDPAMGGMPIQSGDQLVVRPRREIFRNYVLPVVSIAGATAAILNALDRRR